MAKFLCDLIYFSDIELRAQVGRKLPLSRQFCLQFSIRYTTQQTPIAGEKKKLAHWDQELFWDAVDTSALFVKFYQKHRVKKRDELVGILTYTIEEISEKLNNGVFEERLCRDTSHGSDLTSLTIKFSFSTQLTEGPAADEQPGGAVRQTTDEIGTLGSTPVAADLLLLAVDPAFAPQPPASANADKPEDAVAVAKANEVTGARGSTPVVANLLPLAVDTGIIVVAEIQTFETAWGVLLRRLELFDKIVPNTAVIHPYASMAWSVVSAVNKVLVNQKNRDEQIIRLASAMSDVFSSVVVDEPLKEVEKLEKTITLLLQQVMECAHFIADFTKPNSFWTHIAKYTLCDVDAKITAYKDKLRELKEAFLDGVALQTGITFVRMADVVQNIAATACNFIREVGANPCDQVDLLLGGDHGASMYAY